MLNFEINDAHITYEFGTFNGKNESLVTWHCHVWASIQLLGLYLTL
jgi:hypothetical protein